MKVSCLQENLSRGLSVVSRAVATRTTLPITNNVLLATDDSRLRLTATDLEKTITCWIGAQVEEEGAITVPARLLSDFVNSLPSALVDLSLGKEAKTLQLRCAQAKAHMSVVAAEDFPPSPKVEGGRQVQVDAEALRRGLTQIIIGVAKDDTRPVLSGVCFTFSGTTLALAGADGYVLAEYKIGLKAAGEDTVKIIVPGKSCAELLRLLAKQEEPVEIALNKSQDDTHGQVLFRLKSVEMVSQLIQGSFPNYPQLIPQNHYTRTVVSVADFLRAVKTASIFARDDSDIVRLQMAQGKMSVSARGEGIGDNEEDIDAQVEGEEIKIAFKSSQLVDALSVLEEEKVALETTSPSSPGVLRPLGSENYVYVIMPMFVQQPEKEVASATA